jgi:hypothetical protein
VGGIVLPRVELENINTLDPFILSTSTDWALNSGIYKKDLVGLTVYNLTTTSPFIEGLYLWNGTKWTLANSDVENGLRVDDNKIKLGGDLIETTTIKIDGEDLTFDLKGNGESLMIKGLHTQPNSSAVVVDVNTGKLGLAPVMPAKLAFFQSGTESEVSNINTVGTVSVVPWASSDNVTNNLTTFILADNAFEMNEDAMVEISGSCGYRGSLDNPVTTFQVLINLTLQIQRQGSSAWEDFSSVRGVYIGAGAAYRNTLNIPPAMVDAKQGDKIRMILQRPPNTSSGLLGSTHVTTGGSGNGIVKPYGTKFSKSIKIIAQ